MHKRCVFSVPEKCSEIKLPEFQETVCLMMTLHLLFSPAVAHLQRSHHLGCKKLIHITLRNKPNEILKEKISKSRFQKKVLAINLSRMSEKSDLQLKALSIENIHIHSVS